MTRPEPALVEIVERAHPGYDPNDPRSGIIKPDEVRINGIPLLVPVDEGITVHAISIPGDDSLAKVTLTLFARRVLIGPGADAEPTA